jgi:hypothetical protein
MPAESKASVQVKKPASITFIPAAQPRPCRNVRAGNQRRGLTFAAIRSGSFFFWNEYPHTLRACPA